MYAVTEIREEHVIIKRRLRAILGMFGTVVKCREISDSLKEFENFWTRHEEKEEKYFDLFKKNGKKFPYHKTLVSEHKQLKGHWKVLQGFLENKSDLELEIALDTDGRMLIEKFLKHVDSEERYFDEYFN